MTSSLPFDHYSTTSNDCLDCCYSWGRRDACPSQRSDLASPSDSIGSDHCRHAATVELRTQQACSHFQKPQIAVESVITKAAPSSLRSFRMQAEIDHHFITDSLMLHPFHTEATSSLSAQAVEREWQASACAESDWTYADCNCPCFSRPSASSEHATAFP